MPSGPRFAILGPKVHATEIRSVNPFFPEPGAITLTVKIWRPLQKPENVNAFPSILRGVAPCLYQTNSKSGFPGLSCILHFIYDFKNRTKLLSIVGAGWIGEQG